MIRAFDIAFADAFPKMESEITVDFRENSEAYAALYQKI